MNLNNIYYFLRHADTDRSQDIHFSEHPLSVLGHSQARSTSSQLIDLDIDIIFCSPFTRAKQTVEPFAKERGVDPVVTDELCGRIIKNLPREKTWEFFKQSWLDFNHSEYGAETAHECIDRVSTLLSKLEEDHSDKKILLVSHSNPISLFLSTVDSSIDYEWFKRMKSPSLFELRSSDSTLSFTEIDL